MANPSARVRSPASAPSGNFFIPLASALNTTDAGGTHACPRPPSGTTPFTAIARLSQPSGTRCRAFVHVGSVLRITLRYASERLSRARSHCVSLANRRTRCSRRIKKWIPDEMPLFRKRVASAPLRNQFGKMVRISTSVKLRAGPGGMRYSLLNSSWRNRDLGLSEDFAVCGLGSVVTLLFVMLESRLVW